MVTKQLTKMASFLRCINHRKLVCTNAPAATYLLWKLMTSRCQRYIFSLWKITCVRTVFESSISTIFTSSTTFSRFSRILEASVKSKTFASFPRNLSQRRPAAAQTFYDPIVVCPRASCTCLNTFSLHCFWRKTNSTNKEARSTTTSDIDFWQP